MIFVLMQAIHFASPLYLICDGEACETRSLSLADFVAGALQGGAKTIQYRHKRISVEVYEKNLVELASLCQRRAMLIVNDHAALAEKYALPLHLGQEDTLPQNFTQPYGRSTHSIAELDIALTAKPAPSYVALGTMFPSPTKPEIEPNRNLIPEYLKRTALPLVLIGGITLENAGLLPKSERIAYAVIGDAFRYGVTAAAVRDYVAAWH